MGDNMRNLYNIDLENNFEFEMNEFNSKIELLKKKAKNVFDNIDKISIFKTYMSTNRTLTVIEDEIKVRHNRVFNTYCHYHLALDKSFDIYDSMGYCRCYGCGKTLTTVELIRDFIGYHLKKEEKNKIFMNYPEGLAIEVVDAFLNGVKPSFNKDGELMGYDIPKDYEFVNDIGLVTYVLTKAFEYYDSEDINKYIEESDKKTEDQDVRISNYINIHGIDINEKFANKLCVSEDYIKYRLNKHFLDDKLSINRIIELAKRDGQTPYSFEDKKNLITFYETDDKVMNLNIQLLTNFFYHLEALSKDWSIIQNVKIESDKNKFSLSIKKTEDSTVDYEINIEKAKNIKSMIYSSIYNKTINPESNVLSVFSGNYDLSKFPTKTEYTIIQALESSGVDVLFANNEFTHDYRISPYMLNCKPCSEEDANKFIYQNRFIHEALEIEDECLESGLKYIMGANVPIENMLGEVLFKSTCPELWKEYYNNWEESIKKQKVKNKNTKQN